MPAIHSIRRLLPALTKRLLPIVLIAGLTWDAWLGWQSWTQWADQPLPPERVTAKQLRVNESQRQALVNDLTAYRQPVSGPAVPSSTADSSKN